MQVLLSMHLVSFFYNNKDLPLSLDKILAEPGIITESVIDSDLTSSILIHWLYNLS